MYKLALALFLLACNDEVKTEAKNELPTEVNTRENADNPFVLNYATQDSSTVFHDAKALRFTLIEDADNTVAVHLLRFLVTEGDYCNNSVVDYAISSTNPTGYLATVQVTRAEDYPARVTGSFRRLDEHFEINGITYQKYDLTVYTHNPTSVIEFETSTKFCSRLPMPD